MVDLRRRQVDLAVELVVHGAEVVVVGGTARVLRGEATAARDLDVVVDDHGLDDLVAALRPLSGRVTVGQLRRGGAVRVDTSYGPVDVFVGTPPASSYVVVDGVRLRVAA